MRNKISHLLLLGLTLTLVADVACAKHPGKPSSLAEAYGDHFMVGAALNAGQITGKDAEALDLVLEQFNTATAENDMKWESLQPEPGQFDFRVADALVDLGQRHGLTIIGHTLVWHNQTPDWVFEGPDGEPAGRTLLLSRMRDHIFTVVGRYRGRVHGWDVVNEAFNDDGSWRKSQWYQQIGPDYIEKAIHYVRQADPDTEVYYNDYNMFKPGKRDAVFQLVQELKAKGVHIDAVGLQGHYGLDGPSIEEIDASLQLFAEAGIPTMITELDISVLPFPSAEFFGAEITATFEARDELNPYPDGLDSEMQEILANRYAELFSLFLKHRESMERVTFWGVSDRHSWKNNWPVRGRTDYPLLFDRDRQPKAAFHKVLERASEAN